jgi:predicted Rossmann-fold nucleotide-binding protein
MKRSVCVFCGSAPGVSQEYTRATREFARAAVERGLRVVYGGASVGLMGVLADAVLAMNGEVVGVIPGALVDREIAHRG